MILLVGTDTHGERHCVVNFSNIDFIRIEKLILSDFYVICIGSGSQRTSLGYFEKKSTADVVLGDILRKILSCKPEETTIININGENIVSSEDSEDERDN